MRLANEIAARALEHTAAHLHPRMTESEAAALWQAGYAHGTGLHERVDLALGFSLVWSGPGIRTFTATGSRPIRENEPTLFEIWPAPTATGATIRRTSSGDLTPLASPSSSCSASTAPRSTTAGREPARARPARPERPGGDQVPGTAEPSDLPRGRRPRARAALRASGRHRHDRAGDGARDRAGRLLAGGRRPPCRGQLPDHGRRAGEALPLPGRDRARRDDRPRQARTGEINRRALEPQTHDTIGSTTRRCETASRRWASCSRPSC